MVLSVYGLEQNRFPLFDFISYRKERFFAHCTRIILQHPVAVRILSSLPLLAVFVQPRSHVFVSLLYNTTCFGLELSSLARTLGSWVRIPRKAWMFGVCMRLSFVLSFV
jgi:hypothetical protein